MGIDQILALIFLATFLVADFAMIWKAIHRKNDFEIFPPSPEEKDRLRRGCGAKTTETHRHRASGGANQKSNEHTTNHARSPNQDPPTLGQRGPGPGPDSERDGLRQSCIGDGDAG